jgi:hypothetical protein
MTDGVTVAAVLLVAGPILGLIPVAYPPFLPIWSAPRERHIEVVAAHRRAWWLLNAGFGMATVVTAGGLAALAGALDGDPARTAALTAIWVAYAMAGVLWGAVLGIRALVTPLLGSLGATEAPAGEAERLKDAANGGMFAMFIVGTSAALVALGLVLAIGGGVAAPVALLAAAIAAVALGVQVATGDTIPAVLYLPTLLIGIALLAGWT